MKKQAKGEMGMLKKILIGLGIVFAALIVIVAMQPSDFQVTRSATMAATPGTVFAQVNDFHYWKAWSPWANLDPAAKEVYEGPAAGEGAIFRWAGNKEVGEGSMTIVESRPSELIRIQLDFLKPFEATNSTEFTFTPEGDQTLVTWTMSGKKNFVAKAMGLVMNCKKMCGDMFEKGLANLKSAVEGAPVAA